MPIPKDFAPTRESLSNRIIMITGAGGGLGRALAIDCAHAGATVILCGRTLGKLERVYDDIEKCGAPRPAMAVLDLATATAADYDGLASIVGSEFGRLDGLVHCAALLGDRTPLEQYDIPTWCKVMHVNLTAPVILTQVLLPNLRRSSAASVLFVSSGVARAPRPFWGAYGISKSGLDAVCSTWSQELEKEPNIRFNSVNPGRIRTAMRAAAYPAEDPNTLLSPHAVTAPFVYLLSEAARAVNGEYVDAQ